MTAKATRTELIEKTFFELMKTVGTSIPGFVQSFDSDTQQATIQPGLERIDINGNTFVPPPIIKCMVGFSGGDWALEFEINEGTEGLLIISQRCIDSWKDRGGVSPNPIARFHDMQDACFIPGFRSQAKKLPAFQNNGIRIRDNSGDNYVWLKNDNDVEIKCANLTMEVGGTTQINTTDFDVASSSFTHNGTNVGDDHKHPQANDSGGNTEQDTMGPQ